MGRKKRRGTEAATGAGNEHGERLDDPAERLTGGALADVLAMIARLPLSDADKAEAVRRLLGPGESKR